MNVLVEELKLLYSITHKFTSLAAMGALAYHLHRRTNSKTGLWIKGKWHFNPNGTF